MEFEWDEAKRLKVLQKHGLDLRRGAEIVLGEHMQLPARSDVEPRVWAIGLLDGVMVAVLFTMRGETCRLITARRAKRNERRAYLSRHAGGDPPAAG
jgi:uncharacterized DUF497 family protein